MKVFVTGATGFIGGAVAQKLHAAGHRVLGLARSDEAVASLQQQGIEAHRGDLAEPESIARGTQVSDATIHAAAIKMDGKDASSVLEAERNTVAAIIRALERSNKAFIFTSGTGVLGDTGDRIFDEETPFFANPFAVARVETEQEVLRAAASGVRSIVLRPPVVYGRGGGMLIPVGLLQAARRSGVSRYVSGTENNKWSFVHIDDLADLYVLALERAPAGTLFHASSEWGVKTLAIAQAVSRAAGLAGKTESVTLEEGAKIWGEIWADYWATNHQSSGDKAVQLLGWHPQARSILEDIEHGSYRC